MDTPAAARSRRLPLWAALLGALLGVNIIVLLVVLMRSGAPGTPTKDTAQAATARNASPLAADSSGAPEPHFSPMDGAPVYAPEIPVPADSAAQSVPDAPVTASPVAAPHAPGSGLPRKASSSDPLLVDEDSKADNEEILPSISELNLTGPEALPDIHLDVHVYATKPSDRFVYINMRKYHEGSTLQEGPVLERIRRDGVVLDYHGLRFIVPRQS
jgi:general secretion pathway protein B